MTAWFITTLMEDRSVYSLWGPIINAHLEAIDTSYILNVKLEEDLASLGIEFVPYSFLAYAQFLCRSASSLGRGQPSTAMRTLAGHCDFAVWDWAACRHSPPQGHGWNLFTCCPIIDAE